MDNDTRAIGYEQYVTASSQHNSHRGIGKRPDEINQSGNMVKLSKNRSSGRYAKGIEGEQGKVVPEVSHHQIDKV
jgi:hypothetical protein